MDYKRVFKVIKITDRIVDINPEIREAGRKILKSLIKSTGATGGGIFIYDVFDKKLKILSKKGRLSKKIILKSFNKSKTLVNPTEFAVPIVLREMNMKLGLIYLYGKEFTKDDIRSVSASETILDGRFKHERDSTGLKSIFKRYVGEKTMKKILKDPDKEELKGKIHNCSILFADINNFTHYTNTHKSKKVVNFLNNYFNSMSKIALREDGTIDKFVGDAIMVIFGSPIPQKDNAVRAIETGKSMIRKMRELRKEYNVTGGGLSVGIATGKVLSGNIGSKKMMGYTVIGKKVNLASRLTSFAGKNQIIVDSTTKKSAKKFKFKILGKVDLKGFEKVKIFRVVLNPKKK